MCSDADCVLYCVCVSLIHMYFLYTSFLFRNFFLGVCRISGSFLEKSKTLIFFLALDIILDNFICPRNKYTVSINLRYCIVVYLQQKDTYRKAHYLQERTLIANYLVLRIIKSEHWIRLQMSSAPNFLPCNWKTTGD